MIRVGCYVVAAALICVGAGVLALWLGLIVAGVSVALLRWLFEEVPDAKD